MIIGPLIGQIAQLFFMMLVGFVLVRCGLLQQKDSKSLSMVALYVTTPCMIVYAFQIEYTPETRDGLLLAMGSAIAINALMILLSKLLERPLQLSVIERMSIIYSNCGNLIIPIVIALFGQEWVVYASVYMAVQIVLTWTHCWNNMRGKQAFQVRALLTNPNLIAVVLGVFLFLSGLHLPDVLNGSISTMGNMIGPLCMIVTGMLIGGMPLQTLVENKRVFLVVLLRMILFPLAILLLIKGTGATQLSPHGDTILLISFLGAITPAGSTITQMAQVYGQDAEYSSVINVVTTLLCIFTMPVLVGLYQIL